MQQNQYHMPIECARILSLAERDPDMAVREAERELGAAPTSAWWRFTLGWALLRWERLDGAQAWLEAARAEFAALGMAQPELQAAFGLLLVEFNRSATSELGARFEALAEQFEQLGAGADAFRARVQAALLHDNHGSAAEALQLLDQIAPAAGGVEPSDHARWLLARGAVAGSLRQFEIAEQHLAAAEQVFAAEQATIEQAKCWFQHAYLLLLRGQLERAREQYGRADAVFRRLDLPIRRALLDRTFGLLFSRTGEYDQALRHMLSALDAFAKLDRTADMATCQTNLGNIYFYAGWWPIADAYYRRADQLLALAGADERRLTAQRNRGLVAQRTGKLGTALAILQGVYERANTLKVASDAAETLANIAEVLGDMGRYDAAIELYERARAQCLELGQDFTAADAAMDQARLMLRHGDYARAAELFAFAEPHVAQYPANAWRLQHGLARCAEAGDDLARALDHYHQAQRTVAQLRGTLALETASSAIFAQAAELHADSLRCAIEVGDIEALLQFSELQRALVLQRAASSRPLAAPEGDARLAQQQQHIIELQHDDELSDEELAEQLDAALARYGELLLQARHRLPEHSADTAITSISFDLARLREQLNGAYHGDWTALSYLRVGDTLRCVMITPDQLVLAELPRGDLPALIDQATIPAKQRRTFRDFEYRYDHTTSVRWEKLVRLAERLIPAEARARLHPQHRLLIAPTEQLHMLPWAVLRLGERWLAEQAIVQLTPALTVWQALAARAAPPGARALLVGCHTFGDRAAPLPHVADELAMVASTWQGPCDRLLDDEATCAAVRERSASGGLAQYRLLHIATHAALVPEQAFSAHIRLWDDELWLAEVASLRLGKALVVLSACEGASAGLLQGDETLSLSWALLAAGASAVLAHFWKIDDAATLRFMHSFYMHLAAHGDAACALAEAQRATIDQSANTPAEFDELLIWAGFILTGATPT